MLVSEEPLPILNDFFRRMNNRASAISLLSVDASLRNPRSVDNVFGGDLDINITEKKTEVGVPLAPYVVYVNDIETHTGRCDAKGKATQPLTLEKHRSIVDVYHARKRLIEASDTLDILWDNFDDNSLDTKVWGTFSGYPAYYEGTAKTTEKNKRLEFLCSNTGYLAGVYTKSPINLSDSRIRVRLYSGGWVICALTILPSTEPFYGASYNKGYDVMTWQNGLDKFIVYSGPKIAFKKDTIRGNPETVEVVIEGDTIKFLEEGVQVYSEKYKPSSKLCNIRLWGQSWYHFQGGTSWVDDFMVIGD